MSASAFRYAVHTAVESTEQVGARRVEECVRLELAPLRILVEQHEPVRKPFAHRDGHRTIERDHRRWNAGLELAVAQRDLAPTGLLSS
ncbi:MAG TPA: hypothetical protein VIL97_08465 [Thermoanaerobaculia bacterium]